MTDIKNTKSQLKNLQYVKNLKTLTPEQRQILNKKYKQEKYIHIGVPLSKITCVESAKQVFADVVSNMEQKLTRSSLRNVKRAPNNGFYNNNAIKFFGTELRNDSELIKLHTAQLQREFNWKLQLRRDRERRMREAKKTNVNLTVASRKDAETLIKHLKAKFNV